MTPHLLVTALIAVFLSTLIFGLQWVFSYRIKGRTVEFVLFNAVPIYRLSFDKIETVREVTWPEIILILPTIFFLTNRMFVRRFVLIEKRSGFPRRVAITPLDPGKFIDEIHKSKNTQ